MGSKAGPCSAPPDASAPRRVTGAVRAVALPLVAIQVGPPAAAEDQPTATLYGQVVERFAFPRSQPPQWGAGGRGGRGARAQMPPVIGWTFQVQSSELVVATTFFGRNFTEYLIEVQVSGLPSRIIRKRYSMFEEFHQHVLALHYDASPLAE